MNKREEIHFSISADDAFVDSLSGMMMNRRRLLQGKRRIKKCTTTLPYLAHPGRGPVLRRIFWLLQRGNGPQAVAHLILMSVSFLLGLLVDLHGHIQSVSVLSAQETLSQRGGGSFPDCGSGRADAVL